MNRGELSSDCQAVAVAIGAITGDHVSGSCHGYLCEMLDALASGDAARYRAAKIAYKDMECPGSENIEALIKDYTEGNLTNPLLDGTVGTSDDGGGLYSPIGSILQ